MKLKMKTKRLKEYDALHREVIAMLYRDAKRYTNDTKWRNYEQKCTYEGKKYIVRATFRCDPYFLELKKPIEVIQDMGSIILTDAVH